jgi:hypothetical protein
MNFVCFATLVCMLQMAHACDGGNSRRKKLFTISYILNQQAKIVKIENVNLMDFASSVKHV